MIIYKIINIINNKIYIGQTKSQLKKRLTEHFSCAKKGIDTYLYKSIRKYGKENFIIEEIESCTSLEQLNKQETFWIKKLNSLVPNGYNLTMGGDSKILSEQTKIKISKSLKGHIGWFKGKHHTKETKEKCRISALKLHLDGKCGMLGKKHSNETKKKMKINRKDTKGITYEQRFGIEGAKIEKEKQRLSHLGKTHTILTKQKISSTLKGHIVSEETKQKMRKPKTKKIKKYCLENKIIYTEE